MVQQFHTAMNSVRFLILIAFLESHTSVIFSFRLPEENVALSTKHAVQHSDSVAEDDQEPGPELRSVVHELDEHELQSKAFKRSVYLHPEKQFFINEGDTKRQLLLLEGLQSDSPSTFGKTETNAFKHLKKPKPISADLNDEKKKRFESNFRSRTLKFVGEIGDELQETETDEHYRYRSRSLQSIRGVEDEPRLILNQRMLGSERTSMRRRLLAIGTTTAEVAYIHDPNFKKPILFEGFSNEEIKYVDLLPDLDCERDEDGRCTSEDEAKREEYNVLRRHRYAEIQSKLAMLKAENAEDNEMYESTTPQYTYTDGNERESL